MTTSDSHFSVSVNRHGVLGGWLRFKSRSGTAWWALYGAVITLMFIANIRFLLPGGLKAKLIPEEYYVYKISPNGALLLIHLACVLPASVLSIIQFIPGLRAKYMSWHRYAGRVINVLTLISNVTGIAIGPVSFGGDLSIQTGIFALGAMVLYSVIAGWKAIRQRRIEEHRIWMVRAWAYQASIVTMRIILPVAVALIDVRGGYYASMTCDEVSNSLSNTDQFISEYPQCQSNWTGKPVEYVSVRAGLQDGLPLAAGARATFGMSVWVAVWIHFLGMEYYISKSRRVTKVDVKTN